MTTSFDALGRRTALSTTTGAPALTYQYDAAGRLTDVLRAGSLHTHAAYDALGRLSSLTRANGAVSTYSYDGANRLTGLQTATGTALSSFGYTLNRAGQATLLTETLGGSSRTVTLAYDGLRRLVDAVEAPGRHYGYSYDLVGNRLDATVDGVSGGSHSYDAADQVVGWSYDGAGNLLVDDTNLYSYDGLTRLTGVTQTNGSLFSGSSYSYNGDGVLAAETTGGQATRYTLDTSGSLPERLGATTGGTTTWYVRGWGQELSRENGGTSAWYVADRLGSVRATLGGTGALTASYNYDPFGQPEGPATADYGFTGEAQNATTGLVHLRARWFAPNAGRFISKDPDPGQVAQPMSLNSYSYGYNDPIDTIDPSGKCVNYDEHGCLPDEGPSVPESKCMWALDEEVYTEHSNCTPAEERARRYWLQEQQSNPQIYAQTWKTAGGQVVGGIDVVHGTRIGGGPPTGSTASGFSAHTTIKGDGPPSRGSLTTPAGNPGDMVMPTTRALLDPYRGPSGHTPEIIDAVKTTILQTDPDAIAIVRNRALGAEGPEQFWPLKPVGAKNILSGPDGLRLVQLPTGKILIAVSDLDMAGWVSNGVNVTDNDFNTISAELNQNYGREISQHGTHWYGLQARIAGINPAVYGEISSGYLNDRVWVYSAKGLIDSGTMWQMMLKYTGKARHP